MRRLSGALGCTLLLVVVACGDGQQSSDDAFCVDAERAAAAVREYATVTRDIDVAGLSDDDASAAAAELPRQVRDTLREVTGAFDEMIDTADGDVRDDLEAYQENVLRAVLEAIADAESPIEIAVAMADLPDPPEPTSELVERINAATRQRCDITLVPDSPEGPAPWGALDVCSLLPTEAVTDAVPDLEAVDAETTASQRRSEGCRWGDPSGPYVKVELWDPVDPQEFLVGYEEHPEIGGHPAYVLESPSTTVDLCEVVVDNADYFVSIDVKVDPASVPDSACSLADSLAAVALSSLPAN